MTVVFDTNVVISAIFWNGTSRQCLFMWALRRFQLAVTSEILDEYAAVAARMTSKTGTKSSDHIEWIRTKAKLFVPAALGKQRSRDKKDDMFLACALARGARFIVTLDKDLLSLKKPFGIEIIEPGALLKYVSIK